jgi:hypothetical protein
MMSRLSSPELVDQLIRVVERARHFTTTPAGVEVKRWLIILWADFRIELEPDETQQHLYLVRVYGLGGEATTAPLCCPGSFLHFLRLFGQAMRDYGCLM